MEKKMFNDLLVEKGITIYQLSKVSGVPTASLYDLQKNKRDFGRMAVDSALRIAKVLGMTVEEISAELGGNKMERIKHLGDVKKEYGYILRWINPDDRSAGAIWLEKVGHSDERIYISDFDGSIFHKKAYDYILKKRLDAFRDCANVYDNYVHLFEIMGINVK